MKKIRIALFAALAAALCACTAFAYEVNEVYAEHGMVSSAHELASKAGVEIMQKGGNAIDAAVATALALNVTEFNASGIGGGGFMTIRFAKTGEVVCLDYREMAPASATKDMFASEQAKKESWSIYGGKSVGVPGWLMGMDYALKKYGTMSFAEVAAPAIKLAEEGFVFHAKQTDIVADKYDRLVMYNDPATLPFLSGELPFEAGNVFKQPALGKLFRLIAQDGIGVFYGGPVAEAIVSAVNRNGGSMTVEDLKNYRMHVRKPVEGTYRGYRIYSVPPASSGGTHVIQLLNIMENFDVKALGHNTIEFAKVFNPACRLVYADRSAYMADSEFAKLPLAGLQSKEYAKLLADTIKADAVPENPKAGDPWKYESEPRATHVGGLGNERQSTSSFSVVDQAGNIVTSTNTINYYMGSSVYVPEYGFLLNDEMDDFSSNPESVNAPEPGKRPLSSMSPTIVLDPEGRAFMSIGAAGSTRIITAVAQIIMSVIDHGMEMDASIESPRVHNQSGKTVRMDTDRHEKKFTDDIRAAGYEIVETNIGTPHGILFDHAKNRLNGGAYSRGLGVPVGF
ncbi:MAG: gamma-glutamyltransferase [Pyramidobacter sp.]|nr:gamma-glutamyltransferase [Pyramidobacter sp.]